MPSGKSSSYLRIARLMTKWRLPSPPYSFTRAERPVPMISLTVEKLVDLTLYIPACSSSVCKIYPII